MVTFEASKMSGAGQIEAAAALPQPRLVKAAHEFEAQLMKELMAPLTGGSSVPGVGGGVGGGADGAENDDDADGGSGGALGAFASEALAKALSTAGGFGIANQILGEIGPAGGHKQVTSLGR